MVKEKQKKRKSVQGKSPYTLEDTKKALEAVRNGQSIRSASKSFNIPVTTLHSRVAGIYPVNVRKGPATVFTVKEEEELVDWIFKASNGGFPITKQHLLDSIQMIVKKTNRITPFTNGMPSKHWYEGFLRRHPQLSERMCQNITKSRAKISEKGLRWWFDAVKKDLEHLDLLNISPNRIFNLDESAFFLCPKGIKVLVRKGDKAVHNVSGNDKECYTALIGGNAAGQILPTMVIYSNERIPPLVAENFPDDFIIGKSETGWMVSETFYMYMTSVFYPWCIKNEIEFLVVVYVDGHSSHITKPLSDFCVDHRIELVALYPNATHILQPMDVSLFHPLKTKYRDAIRKWRMENDGALLTKIHFAGVLKSALDSLDLKKIFSNGFKRCGLSPFSADAINYSKLLQIDAQMEVEKDQTSCETNVEGSSFQLFSFESHLDADILMQFKNHDNSIEWTGSLEFKELYKFWLKCQQSVPRMSDQSVTDTAIENSLIIEISEDLINEGCSLSKELSDNGYLITSEPSDNLQETDIVMELSCDESQMEIDLPSSKATGIDGSKSIWEVEMETSESSYSNQGEKEISEEAHNERYVKQDVNISSTNSKIEEYQTTSHAVIDSSINGDFESENNCERPLDLCIGHNSNTLKHSNCLAMRPKSSSFDTNVAGETDGLKIIRAVSEPCLENSKSSATLPLMEICNNNNLVNKEGITTVPENNSSTSKSIVETAFKDFLFMPKFDKSTKKRKGSQEKKPIDESKPNYPPVATGSAWRNLWDITEKKKQEEERIKAEKKSKMMQNKKIKTELEENLKKIRPKKKQVLDEIKQSDLKLKQYKAQEKLLCIQLKNKQFKENQAVIETEINSIKSKIGEEVLRKKTLIKDKANLLSDEKEIKNSLSTTKKPLKKTQTD